MHSQMAVNMAAIQWDQQWTHNEKEIRIYPLIKEITTELDAKKKQTEKWSMKNLMRSFIKTNIVQPWRCDNKQIFNLAVNQKVKIILWNTQWSTYPCSFVDACGFNTSQEGDGAVAVSKNMLLKRQSQKIVLQPAAITLSCCVSLPPLGSQLCVL